VLGQYFRIEGKEKPGRRAPVDVHCVISDEVESVLGVGDHHEAPVPIRPIEVRRKQFRVELLHAVIRVDDALLHGQNDLPLSGNHIGDARYVAGDKHWYVWLIQSANSAPAWIDP